MHETYQHPTTSLTGPPHDHTHPLWVPSFAAFSSPAGPPHDHIHPRLSACLRHSHTHPRHSRTLPRHSRVGGNPPRCAQTLEETALLPSSTKPDENRQNPTKSDGNSCARVPLFPRTRARQRRSVPFSLHGSDSTYRLELPSHKPHANKSNGTWTGKSDCSVCAACTRIAADWTHRTESPSTGRRRVSFVRGRPLPTPGNGTWRKIVFPSQRPAYMLTTCIRNT